MEINLKGDQILSIKGDKLDPFSQGHICPKATALQDVYEDADRLKVPVRRTANGWEQIGWEEAFDEVAQRLLAIREAYGRQATGIYLGNPNVHNIGSQLLLAPFIRSLHTTNRFSATSVDQLPHHFASHHVFGHQWLLPVPDVDRTDYFLILGANPLVSNGSLMTAGGISRRLRAMQERGGKVVVVDPRRTETAEKADWHVFIRPESDVLLLLSMVHTIFEEGLDDPGRLEAFTEGLDTIREMAAAYTPERVAGLTGIEAEDIRRLAREFGTAKTAVCYGRMGLSTQAFGGLCQWLVIVLNVISGNLDRAGGSMFTTPAIDVVASRRAGSHGRWSSRVRGLPEFGGELPAAVMVEEMMQPGEGQIRAFVTVAGNPVLSTPNGRRLDEALAGLEFMVAIDIYINETTRHAHIILPPTTGLETEHYDLFFHLLAVRNSAKYSPPLFEPDEEQRHDWQIYRALSERLDAERHARNPISMMTPVQMLDFGLQSGPYGGDGMSLARLQEAAHGVDLGPLLPQLPERLTTEGKRMQLAPAVFLADLARGDETFKISALGELTGHGEAVGNASDPFDLRLIGRRQLRSNNSWMHNSERLVKGKERCTALMNAVDAASRQLVDGQMVRVSSSVGAIDLPLAVSEEMMPGVVSIPHGWGHKGEGLRLSVAENYPGASVNDLTEDGRVDELTGNAALSGVMVSVVSGDRPVSPGRRSGQR